MKAPPGDFYFLKVGLAKLAGSESYCCVLIFPLEEIHQ
jgi:hypothetical protein